MGVITPRSFIGGVFTLSVQDKKSGHQSIPTCRKHRSTLYPTPPNDSCVHAGVRFWDRAVSGIEVETAAFSFAASMYCF